MIMAGATRIREVAVIAEKLELCPPCGGCRQRLAEFADADTLVHLCDAGGMRQTLRMDRIASPWFQDGGDRMSTVIDVLTDRLRGLMPRHALDPRIRIGSLVETVADPVRIPYGDLPGFPESGVSGHAGEVVAGHIGKTPVIMLSGRVHYYEHGKADAMRAPLEALQGIGVTNLILTNAAGSLREDMPPGSVMRIYRSHQFLGQQSVVRRTQRPPVCWHDQRL
jgi:hypothetical protein